MGPVLLFDFLLLVQNTLSPGLCFPLTGCTKCSRRPSRSRLGGGEWKEGEREGEEEEGEEEEKESEKEDKEKGEGGGERRRRRGGGGRGREEGEAVEGKGEGRQGGRSPGHLPSCPALHGLGHLQGFTRKGPADRPPYTTCTWSAH